MQAQRSATTRWRDRGADVSVQRQARALGDPTRHAIFRYVADSSQPVDIATLTAHFGLNHNAIRQHLTKLCAARLLIEAQAVPTGPGRPRLEYRPAPEGAGSWGTPSPYQQLSLLLLAVLRSGRAARAVGAEAGRALARDLPQAPDPVDVLEAHAARQGFEPQRIERPSSVELVLGRCPFADAAATDPEIVCGLHRGLAEGIAEATGGTVEVTNLVARNPKRAGCRLQLHRVSLPGGRVHVSGDE